MTIRYRSPRAQGFTLVELLVTLMVAAILLSLAVPSFRNIILTNRLAAQVNDFVTTLHVARSEAIKRGVRVTICKSAGPAYSACTASGGWEQGWIVFVDSDGDAVKDNDEDILQVHGSLPANGSLKGNTNLAAYISYMPNGATQKIDNSTQSGALALCVDTTEPTPFSDQMAKVIDISTTGRVRTVKPSGAASTGISSCTP